MNSQQEKRYQKIYEEELYLLDKLVDKDNMTFHISGSTKNIYKVVIYDKHKNIDCNCPDNRSWAKKYNVVCKHSCFILFKVLKAFNKDGTNFFGTLHFSQNEMLLLKEKFDKLTVVDNDADYINKEYLEKYKNVGVENGKDLFKQKKVLDEEEYCVICFDEFTDNKNIECPTCHNIIHKQCMIKWIKMGKTSCVYCRSEIWKNFMNESAYASLL